MKMLQYGLFFALYLGLCCPKDFPIDFNTFSRSGLADDKFIIPDHESNNFPMFFDGPAENLAISPAKSIFDDVDIFLIDRPMEWIANLDNIEKDVMKTLELAAQEREKFDKEMRQEYNEFFRFIGRFDKTYDSDDILSTKFKNFQQAMNRIKLENQGLEDQIFGITSFSDLSDDEFLHDYTGLLRHPLMPNISMANEMDLKIFLDKPKDETVHDKRKLTGKIPGHLDYRKNGAVSPVLHQKGCGACYAFSVVAQIEGLLATKIGQLVPLSQQELISCTQTEKGNDGCKGGYLDVALNYVRDHGITAADSMPFVSSKEHTPQCQQYEKVTKIQGYKQIPPGREDLMKKFLYSQGPLSVTLDARPLRDYTHGILRPKMPVQGWQITHAVTIVGYGEGTDPYWIVKNSWGTGWGEKGYFRLLRGNNSLAIAQESYVAFI